jgi:hypothetical protein
MLDQDFSWTASQLSEFCVCLRRNDSASNIMGYCECGIGGTGALGGGGGNCPATTVIPTNLGGDVYDGELTEPVGGLRLATLLAVALRFGAAAI